MESRNRDLAVHGPHRGAHQTGCLPTACGSDSFGVALPPQHPRSSYHLPNCWGSLLDQAPTAWEAAGLGVVRPCSGGVTALPPVPTNGVHHGDWA